jgi:hypothetical protein
MQRTKKPGFVGFFLFCFLSLVPMPVGLANELLRLHAFLRTINVIVCWPCATPSTAAAVV